jgi:hypothetical protein
MRLNGSTRITWPRRLTAAAALILLFWTAASSSSEPLHPQGTWGTAPACEAWRSGEEPRPELTLYQVGPQWIQRHIFFCLVRPQMTVVTPDGRWLLQVVCGEDARQTERHLTMNLDREDALTVSWTAIGDDVTFTFGPFERCDR